MTNNIRHGLLANAKALGKLVLRQMFYSVKPSHLGDLLHRELGSGFAGTAKLQQGVEWYRSACRVLVSATKNDLRDGYLVDVVHLSYARLAMLSGCVKRTDLVSNFIGNLSAWMAIAGTVLRSTLATLVDHIDSIVPFVSEKQVIWPNAGWKIALMENELSGRYGTVMEHPRNSMSGKIGIAISLIGSLIWDMKNSVFVSTAFDVSGPWPTAIWVRFINTLPKGVYILREKFRDFTRVFVWHAPEYSLSGVPEQL